MARRFLVAVILCVLALAVPAASQADCIGNQGTHVCATGANVCAYNNVGVYESVCAGPMQGLKVGGTGVGEQSASGYHGDHDLYWWAGPPGAYLDVCAGASGPVLGYYITARACATDGAGLSTLPSGYNYAYVTINQFCAGIKVPIPGVFGIGTYC